MRCNALLKEKDLWRSAAGISAKPEISLGPGSEKCSLRTDLKCCLSCSVFIMTLILPCEKKIQYVFQWQLESQGNSKSRKLRRTEFLRIVMTRFIM